eukprot:2898569-Pleurochrysis_carterae.AAC.1
MSLQPTRRECVICAQALQKAAEAAAYAATVSARARQARSFACEPLHQTLRLSCATYGSARSQSTARPEQHRIMPLVG